MDNNTKDIIVYIVEMHAYVDELRGYIQNIHECMVQMNQTQQLAALPPLSERKRWNKREVMELLKMSDSTYKRNVRVELLVPMCLSGDDEYFEEDLLRALEESKRRGRT